MKNIFNKKFLSIAIFSATVVTFPFVAQGAIVTNTNPTELNDFVRLAVNVATWILGIVGSLALLMFVIGGFMFLISAGNSKTVEQGKSIIIGAVIGLLIVFSSYMIIQFSMSALGLQWSGNTSVPTPTAVAPIPAAEEPCAVQFSSQGYACILPSNGHDCKPTLNLCPNVEEAKCCLPN